MKKALLGVLAILLLASCKRDGLPNFDGNLICATEKFELLEPLTVSDTNINLNSVESLRITAKFNESLPWELEIKGLTSGARKVIKGGRDTKVDVKWYGNPSFPRFFEKETCRLILRVSCEKVYTAEFKLAEKPNFRKSTPFSVMLTDFEDGRTHNFSTGAGLTVDTSRANQNLGASPQGGNYFRYYQSRIQNTWFFGQITINRASNLKADLQNNFSKTDTKNLYFNMFYAGGGFSNNEIYVRFGEKRALRRELTNTNWAYAYVKLGDLFIDNYNAMVNNPEIMLQSYPEQTNVAEMNVDFLIFTYKEPFFDFNVSE